MPRGRFVKHKGQSRHFTNPQELEREKTKGTDDDENIGMTGEEDAADTSPADSRENEEDKSEVDRHARKGVAALIKIENPNRVFKKATQKVTNFPLDDGAPKNLELTRHDREQLEQIKARRRYEKLHAEGKTTEAQADLARLAVIRQQRAEAAAKRAADKKTLEEKKKNPSLKS